MSTHSRKWWLLSIILFFGILARPNFSFSEEKSFQQDFEKTCLTAGRNFTALKGLFDQMGWKNTTSAPTGVAADLMNTASVAMKSMGDGVKVDEIVTFQRNRNGAEEVAILSFFQIAARKAIGCQIYYPSASVSDFPTRFPTLLEITEAKKATDGASKFVKWKRPKTMPGYISITEGFIAPGGQLASQIGFSGISMSSTSEQEE